jgi:hypothetical protein
MKRSPTTWHEGLIDGPCSLAPKKQRVVSESPTLASSSCFDSDTLSQQLPVFQTILTDLQSLLPSFEDLARATDETQWGFFLFPPPFESVASGEYRYGSYGSTSTAPNPHDFRSTTPWAFPSQEELTCPPVLQHIPLNYDGYHKLCGDLEEVRQGLAPLNVVDIGPPNQNLIGPEGMEPPSMQSPQAGAYHPNTQDQELDTYGPGDTTMADGLFSQTTTENAGYNICFGMVRSQRGDSMLKLTSHRYRQAL